MPRKIRPLARFEHHSVALFAALAMGSSGVAAQGVSAGEPGARAGFVQVQNVATAGSAPAHTVNSVDAAFTRADVDGDNRLSRQEALRLPAVTERFDEMDTNHDRFLSREEFRSGVAN